MRTSFNIAMWCGLILVTAQIVAAQDRNDRRRQFFEGVFRTLVESQIDRPDPNNRPPGRPGGRNPQLIATQKTLERFSDESGHLLTALRREEQVNPAYRSLLGDVVRVKANADVLMRRADRMSAEQFSHEYLTIDREWRVISHRLRQIQNFDRDCLTHVEKLNVYDQQICELLKLTPQFDRLELSRQVAELRVSLQTLLEDLSFDLRRQPGGSAILLDGQTLEASVDRLGHLISQDSPHQVVVAEYQQIYARWRALANRVRNSNNRYIARRIQRVESTHETIHQLLWIPKAIDRGELLVLIKTLKHDIHHVHAGITLDHLLEHADPQEAVASAGALNDACANLIRSLAGQTSLDDLVWDFRMLEVEWQTAASQLASWKEADLDQRLAAAHRTMEILSHTLGQEFTIDHHEVVAIAAAVHDAADTLASQTVRLVNSSPYSPAFRASASAAAQEFADAAHHLHETLTRHADEDHLKRDCNELAASWKTVQSSIAGFNPQQRQFLGNIARPLGPGIAKMQILYAY